MTIEISVPDLSQLTSDQVILGSLAVWYVVAAGLLRLVWYNPRDGDERGMRIIVWLVSPVVGPFAAVTVVLWPLTFGVVQPMWRWGKCSS